MPSFTKKSQLCLLLFSHFLNLARSDIFCVIIVQRRSSMCFFIFFDSVAYYIDKILFGFGHQLVAVFRNDAFQYIANEDF